MKTTNVPTEWFNELKRLSELAYINEDVDSLRLAEINGQIKAHINCLKYFNQNNDLDLKKFAKWLYTNYAYNSKANLYSQGYNLLTFTEVLEAFKQSKK